jgi:FAD/FMN-containing dehydrogenase
MEVITNSIRVAKLSLDYYHFSPVLRSQLRDKRGDLVVSPVSEAEVLQVAQVCVKYQVPLTVREVPSSTDGSGGSNRKLWAVRPPRRRRDSR